MQTKLINRFLSPSSIVTVRKVRVHASPEEVYQALLQLDCTQVAESSRLMRTLSWMREMPHHITRLPNRVYCFLNGKHKTDEGALTYQLKELTDKGVWVKLAESPNEEFVFGLIGKLWHKNYGAIPIKADEFVSFNQPGFAKTVCSYALEPKGSDQTLLVYEIRTGTTDRRTKPLYYLYWLSIECGVLYLMHCLLQSVKREAEKQHGQHWGAGHGHWKGHAA